MRAALQQGFVYGGVDNERLLHGLGRITGRLLDVGSGAGSWAPRLRAAGARELVALDSSREAVSLARERYDLAVLGTIEQVALAELGGEPFDIIVVADVLEHLIDPRYALCRLHGWAVPGALLAVSVPNLRFYRLVGNLIARGEFEYERSSVRDWTHLRWFTRRSLARALRATGWLPERWLGTRSLKGRALAALSDTLANDLLQQQLAVIARRAPATPAVLSVART